MKVVSVQNSTPSASGRGGLRLIVAALLVCLSGLAQADQAAFGIRFQDIIPPPPADDSQAGQADMETLINMQADRTEAMIKEAKDGDRQTPFSIGRPVVGDWFRSADLPKSKQAFNEIHKMANPICDAAKAHWNRQRPYFRDSRIQPLVGHPGNASYPSGHSFAAAICGIVLAQVFPDKAKEIDKEVRRACWRRVIAGVHYPTDTLAGYQLAQAVGRELLKDPVAQRNIEIIRKETAAYQGTLKKHPSP